MKAPAQRTSAIPAAARKPRMANAPRATAAPDASVREALRTPLAVQTKVSVGPAKDHFEQEADRVADHIAAGQPAPRISRLQATPALEPASPQREDDPARRPVQRDTDPDLEDLGAPTLDDTAQHAIDQKGVGQPLAPATRQRLEAGLGVDLEAVRVHADSRANAAARALQARAFTHGNRIWLGQGETQDDMHLMAHEATHVVQQQAGLVQRVVQRARKGAAGGPLQVNTLYLPKIKKRLFKNYQDWSQLHRVAGMPFPRGDPKQKEKWLAQGAVTLPADKVLKQLDVDVGKPPAQLKVMAGSKAITLGDDHDLIEDLKIPLWNKKGAPVTDETSFEVDHQVELQVSGWPATQTANGFGNLELLDRKSNGASGNDMKRALRVSVAQQLLDDGDIQAKDGDDSRKRQVRDILRQRGAQFKKVSLNPWPNKLYEPKGDALEAGSQFWSKGEIEKGEHLPLVQPAKQLGEAGSASSYAVLAPARTAVLGKFKPAAGAQAQSLAVDAAQQKSVMGLTIVALNLSANWRDAAKDKPVGSLMVQLDPGDKVKFPKTPFKLPLARHEENTGYIEQVPKLFSGSVNGLSPFELTHAGITDDRLTASGKLSPSVPMLGRLPLEVRLNGRDIELRFTYDAGDLKPPIPRLNIDDSSLFVGFGTAGLSAGGDVDFSIDGLGSGRLGAKVNSEREFEAEGGFSFDTSLFDRASVDMWYRQKEGKHRLGGRGVLAIDQPGKVRGIASAEFTAVFDDGRFQAQGLVKPSVPGVEQAELTLTHDQAQGLVITGNLKFGQGLPGLRAGTLNATVSERAEGWKLQANGEAQAGIPGIETALQVIYDDGAFDARFDAAFQRGLLSGQVQGGISNRALDAQGAPTGAVQPDQPPIIYGAGQATLRLTPWLQGTAGMRLAPNGEVTVSGEIGLPSQLQVFGRQQLDRKLFGIAVQAPIVPGVVAEIGGDLGAQAGVGPGMLDQLRLGVVYNPAREKDTRVTGDAHLQIPADAGLRLAVHAGIGLGIPGASATGGFEIAGNLGLAGAAEAGVHVAWSPAKGLTLDAEGRISATPQFVFDISGLVNVRVGPLALYEKRWKLASYKYGADLPFGVRFPVHYVEGQPFTLSADDMQFSVPKVDPAALLKGLVQEVAGG